MFKWSPDEKYLARVTPGQQISVYEVPSMQLLGKKSVKIDGVVDFEWAPLNDKERDELEAERSGDPERKADKKKAGTPIRENIIAFWTPEVANQPARVTLMTLPSRTTLRSKNLFNVHDVRLCRSRLRLCAGKLTLARERSARSTGSRTATTSASRSTVTPRRRRRSTATSSSSVSATRTAPSRSSRSRVRLRLHFASSLATQLTTIAFPDAVTAFAWEPKGDRFVLITTNDPNHGQVAAGVLLKTSVAFYGFDSRKGDFLQLSTPILSLLCNVVSKLTRTCRNVRQQDVQHGLLVAQGSPLPYRHARIQLQV